jgi:hypothetical protein
MTCRLWASFLLFFGLMLASCSPAPTLDAQDWPDDDDIATWIALTLTQRFEDGQQVTPQPEGQIPGDQTVEGELGLGDSDGDAIFVGTRTQDVLPSRTDESMGNGQAVDETETPIDATTLTPVPEETQKLLTETPTVRVTDTPMLTEDRAPDIIAGIPGFNALDLAEHLSGYGFDCPGEVNPSGISHEEMCVFDSEEFRFEVTVWGKGVESIDLVEAAVFYFGDLDYSSFVSVLFEAVAEISYDGSVPDEAKDWVIDKVSEIQQIGDEAVDEFGGVRYYIYALLSAQVLEIGHLPIE